MSSVLVVIIAYHIWKASYNMIVCDIYLCFIIAYHIWKASYNSFIVQSLVLLIIAYHIWKASYNQRHKKTADKRRLF